MPEQSIGQVTLPTTPAISYSDQISITHAGCGSVTINIDGEVRSFETYERHVKTVADAFLRRCITYFEELYAPVIAENPSAQIPQITNVSFKLVTAEGLVAEPQGYSCFSGTFTGCSLWASINEENQITVDHNYLAPEKAEEARLQWLEDEQRKKQRQAEIAAIENFDDVIPYILSGDFEVFKNKTQFMDYFHNDFLKAYSYVCKSVINPAEVRTITNIETTSRGGVDTGSRQVGEAQTIYMEPRFAPQFDAKYKAGNRYMLSRYGLNVKEFVHFAVQNRDQVEDFLKAKGCQSNETKILLENLYRYSTGKAPLKNP